MYKTIEFKANPTPKQAQLLTQWLQQATIVWNRGLHLLEWHQHYQRVQACEAVPCEEIQHRGARIFCFNNAKDKSTPKPQDFGLYCRIASEFRLDKTKGREVAGNLEVRYCVPIAPAYWSQQPTFSTGLGLKKEFARCRWHDERITMPQLWINELIDCSLVKAWKEYQKGKRQKPRYRRPNDPPVTLEGRSSGQYGAYEGDYVKLPSMSLHVPGLAKALGGRKIASFRLTCKPTGWYFQAAVESTVTPPRAIAPQVEPIVITMGDDPEVLYRTEHWTVPTQGLTKEEERRKIFYQRKAAKCQVGSRRWQRYTQLAAKIDEKGARRRRQWQHQQSAALVRIGKHRGIKIQIHTSNVGVQKPDPKIAPEGTHYLPNGAQRKARRNRAQLSAGWGQFRTLIKEKAERAGVPVQEVRLKSVDIPVVLPKTVPAGADIVPNVTPPQQQPKVRKKQRLRFVAHAGDSTPKLDTGGKYPIQYTNRAINRKAKENQELLGG